MFINVVLKDQHLSISCGPATQPLRWLADVACLRYDAQLGKLLGPPAGLRTSKGAALDLSLRIVDALQDGDEVVVVLNSDIEEDMQHQAWHNQPLQEGDADDTEEEEGEEEVETERKEQLDVMQAGEEEEEEQGPYSDDSSDDEEVDSPAARSR